MFGVAQRFIRGPGRPGPVEQFNMLSARLLCPDPHDLAHGAVHVIFVLFIMHIINASGARAECISR